MALRIAQSQVRSWREEGFFFAEQVVSSRLLDSLRDECQRFMSLADAEMDRQGKVVVGLNHRGKRYFLSMKARESDVIRELAFSDEMAEVCRATIGENAWFFLDQFVMKTADQGMKFAWHQDSGYIPYQHRPYITVWCPLDDVNEQNGTVYVLPYDRAGTRECVPHIAEAGSNDRVGYHGDDPGIPAIMKAGDAAVFSSTTFHRCGPNQTRRPRRVMLLQYSAEPILEVDGRPPHWADPFLAAGRKVAVVGGPD
jgi:ectoine hydroxylase-related dioxygenase (phytanoyl-CoA dioxygenase family)